MRTRWGVVYEQDDPLFFDENCLRLFIFDIFTHVKVTICVVNKAALIIFLSGREFFRRYFILVMTADGSGPHYVCVKRHQMKV